MRWLWLYLRCRNVLPAVTVTVTAIVTTWAMWVTFSDTQVIHPALTALTVALAVIPISATLTGPTDAVERTAAVSWPLRRTAHLLAWAGVVIGLALSTRFTLDWFVSARYTPPELVLRDTAGLLGLTVLGAAVLGAQRAWIAPLTWSLVSVVLAVTPTPGRPRPSYQQVVMWTTSSARPAVVTAVTLTAVGLAVHALRGPRADQSLHP